MESEASGYLPSCCLIDPYHGFFNYGGTFYVFSLLVLGTLTVAVQGIQTNAFAAHEGPYFYHEGLESSFDNVSKDTGGLNDVVQEFLALTAELSEIADSGISQSQGTVGDFIDPCPYPQCF